MRAITELDLAPLPNGEREVMLLTLMAARSRAFKEPDVGAMGQYRATVWRGMAWRISRRLDLE